MLCNNSKQVNKYMRMQHIFVHNGSFSSSLVTDCGFECSIRPEFIFFYFTGGLWCRSEEILVNTEYFCILWGCQVWEHITPVLWSLHWLPIGFWSNVGDWCCPVKLFMASHLDTFRVSSGLPSPANLGPTIRLSREKLLQIPHF